MIYKTKVVLSLPDSAVSKANMHIFLVKNHSNLKENIFSMDGHVGPDYKLQTTSP